LNEATPTSLYWSKISKSAHALLVFTSIYFDVQTLDVCILKAQLRHDICSARVCLKIKIEQKKLSIGHMPHEDPNNAANCARVWVFEMYASQPCVGPAGATTPFRPHHKEILSQKREVTKYSGTVIFSWGRSQL
jgi:hypothetical protein